MDMPKTLQQAIIHYSDPDNCIAFLVSRRWPDGVVKCPTCGSDAVKYVPTRRVWQCKTRHAKCQFSIKVGTIFEDSAIGLDKWLTAMWLVANSKNGVSSHEVSRSLGITQKSAWHMVHRIRLAMREDDGIHTIGSHWGNPIEIDETFSAVRQRTSTSPSASRPSARPSSWECSIARVARFERRSSRTRSGRPSRNP